MSVEMDPLLIEQKDPEFKNPCLGGRINFAASAELRFFEVHSCSSSHGISERKIEEEVALSHWLLKVFISLSTCTGSQR